MPAMNDKEKNTIRLLGRFESIAARTDTLYRRTGLKCYREMCDDANRQIADLRATQAKREAVSA